jgi:hypothetical protein
LSKDVQEVRDRIFVGVLGRAFQERREHMQRSWGRNMPGAPGRHGRAVVPGGERRGDGGLAGCGEDFGFFSFFFVGTGV